MNGRELVREALAYHETAPVPYFLNFNPPLKKRLEAYFRTDDIGRFLGNHLIWTQVNPTIPADLVGSRYTDSFGITWDNVGDNRGYVADRPLKEPTLEGYEFPEPCPQSALNRIEGEIDANRDLFVLVKLGDLFERAHFLRGMEELMVDMYEHPSFVHELFERLASYNMAVVEKLSDLDIDGLSLSDDYGHQGGLLISPDHWRRFIKPHLKVIFSKVKEKRFYVFLHSDGDIAELIPELIELGVDALHPVQSEVMDLAWLKREFGKDLIFFGGMSTQVTLPLGRPEEIKREVEGTRSMMGKGGGFIMAPGIGMQEDTPLENALAFIEAVTCRSSIGRRR